MERKLWEALYHLVGRVSRGTASPRVVFSDRWIVWVYFWSVVHDRPRCWALQRRHWPTGLGPCQLPSESTLSRRLRQPALTSLVTAVSAALGTDPAATLLKVLDAKPLPVGSMSKDPDARWGQAGKAQAKGSKLFALWGNGSLPLAWSVGPMNADEGTRAQALLPQLRGGGYVLGDCAYDENALYELAWQPNHQLLAPRKQPGKGLGHRRHSPQRLRSIALLEGFGGQGRLAFGTKLYAGRTEVERRFSQLTCYGGGLGPLPAWVRRMHRVTLWVHAKLILRAVTEALSQGLAA